MSIWVYRHIHTHEPATPDSKNGYQVGFFAPDGTWHKDSTHLNRDSAADRVNWLNGGPGGRLLKVRSVDDDRPAPAFNGGSPR